MINDKPVIIALADDDKVFQFITGKILKSLNLIDKLLQFDNGQELLDYLKKNYNIAENLPEIIFLDIQMPFMDGWQFLKEYSNLKVKFAKEIGVYILSSSISLYDKEKSKSFQQIKNYLVKPIERKDYIRIIEENYK